jgi:uncharacterized protein YcbX
MPTKRANKKFSERAIHIDNKHNMDDRQIAIAGLVILLSICLSTIQVRRFVATWISRLRLHLVLLQISKKRSNELAVAARVQGLYIYPGKCMVAERICGLPFLFGRSLHFCDLVFSFLISLLLARCTLVKSLRAVSLTSATLDDRGFVHDRRFMLVFPRPLPLWGSFEPNEATHQFLTQRQCPILATITARLDEHESHLILSCQDKTVSISLDSTLSSSSSSSSTTKNAKTYLARIWDDVVSVIDVGDEAATFVQSIVDQDTSVQPVTGIRLVIQSQADGRAADDSYVPAVARTWMGTTPRVALSDGFPILLACQASLDELNRRLVNKGQPAISMSRFRPNIVIEDTEPFEEDTWKTIVVGNVILHVVKGCPRCKQSCTDQQTGQVFEEPLLTLTEFRAHGDGAYFAQNVVPHLPKGSIRVGAPVTVVSKGAPVWNREPVVLE